MPVQSEDPGCLMGCLPMLALGVGLAIVQHFDERNKRKAERLEEETHVLRLEAEKERLLAERAGADVERKRRWMLDTLCARRATSGGMR